MKFKTTLLLTLSFFFLMLAASLASAFVGYLMGREALKVVTQPDVQSQNSVSDKQPVGEHKGLQLVDEREIIVDVYNRIQEREKKNNADSSSEAVPAIKLADIPPKVQTVANFQPVTSKSQGVTLMISDARYDKDSLLLELELKNENPYTVRFLYSFIDIRDDRLLPLSAIPEDLPTELPADGRNYQGKLRIPLTLLENSKQISLTLTDYPRREIELKLNNIPIDTDR